MTTTHSLAPRKVDAYTQDINRLSNRLTARVGGAAMKILDDGGVVSVRKLARETGLPESRVAKLVARYVKADTPVAQVATTTKVDALTELNAIMRATAPMASAIATMSRKLHVLGHNHRETRGAFFGGHHVSVGIAATTLVLSMAAANAIVGSTEVPLAIFATGMGTALLVGGLRAWDDWRITKHCKFSSTDVRDLVAMRDAEPDANTRFVMTDMLCTLARSLDGDGKDALSPVAAAALEKLPKQHSNTVGSPAAAAAAGLRRLGGTLAMATQGVLEIEAALARATPGRERDRLTKALYDHAFRGDECVLPIAVSTQRELASALSRYTGA